MATSPGSTGREPCKFVIEVGACILCRPGRHPTPPARSATSGRLDRSPQPAGSRRGPGTRGRRSAMDADKRLAGGDVAERSIAYTRRRRLSQHTTTYLRRETSDEPGCAVDRCCWRLPWVASGGARPFQLLALFRIHQSVGSRRLLREQKSFLCASLFAHIACNLLGNRCRIKSQSVVESQG